MGEQADVKTEFFVYRRAVTPARFEITAAFCGKTELI